MRIATAQFAVATDPDHNLATVARLLAESDAAGARVLLLPEGIIARDPANPDITGAAAQPADGPFMTALRRLSRDSDVALATTVHLIEDGAIFNVFVVLLRGEELLHYRKLHLYDAFASRESDRVTPGGVIPPLVTIDGWAFGALTCYDVRFPELARAHAVAGADVLLLPAAWVRGPAKEQHWLTLSAARALENTCYLVSSGENSVRNIGRSLVLDPMGIVVADAGTRDGLLVADLDREHLVDVRHRLPVLANRRFADPVLA